eukprot:scaffold77681_cov18-Tisochrysis_lutea.AAC.1
MAPLVDHIVPKLTLEIHGLGGGFLGDGHFQGNRCVHYVVWNLHLGVDLQQHLQCIEAAVCAGYNALWEQHVKNVSFSHMFASLQSVAKYLLEAGAPPNDQDAFGITAMYEAVRMGHVEVIEVLKEHDA